MDDVPPVTACDEQISTRIKHGLWLLTAPEGKIVDWGKMVGLIVLCGIILVTCHSETRFRMTGVSQTGHLVKHLYRMLNSVNYLPGFKVGS
jgi:hypothetical protein